MGSSSFGLGRLATVVTTVRGRFRGVKAVE
jgi:hypothetical protein